MITEKAQPNKTLDDAYKASEWLKKYASSLASQNHKGWFDQPPHRPAFSLWDKTKITGFALMAGTVMSGFGYGNGTVISAFTGGDYSLHGAAAGFVFGLWCSPRNQKYGPSAFGAHILGHAFRIAAAPAAEKAASLIRAWAETKDPRIAFNDQHGNTIFPPGAPLPATKLLDVTPRQASPMANFS